VCFQGVTNCIGAVLGGMLERGKGHIVNMSSDAGRRVSGDGDIYNFKATHESNSMLNPSHYDF